MDTELAAIYTARENMHSASDYMNKVEKQAYADSAADLGVIKSPWAVGGKKGAKKEEGQPAK